MTIQRDARVSHELGDRSIEYTIPAGSDRVFIWGRGENMRTLKDEAGRFGYLHMPGYNTFMDKYGPWQVVEGVLTTKCGHRQNGISRVVIVPRDEPGGTDWVELGQLGDRVKLIVPPEKKEPEPRVLVAALEDAERRAFRYEKALREIADHAQKMCGEEGTAREYLLLALASMRVTAQKAMGTEESNQPILKARIDKYERALREIEGRGEVVGEMKSMWGTAFKQGLAQAGAIAREALDD